MKTGVGVAILAAVVVATILFVFFSNSGFTGNYVKIESASTGKTVEGIPGQAKTYTVEITSSGFSPKELSINKGDTVTWVNSDTAEHWPASAMHPTHTVYPGSNIEKCGTSEEPNLFDSCRGIPSGESYSFTFNEVGSWGYHDHIVNGLYGKIVVN